MTAWCTKMRSETDMRYRKRAGAYVDRVEAGIAMHFARKEDDSIV